jgi:hypothetical protein
MTKAVTPDLDYPVAAPADVDPIIYRSQIIQAMAARYQQAAPELSNEEAHDSAMSTWGTDWDTDPEPRSIEASYPEVDADLSYWGEE